MKIQKPYKIASAARAVGVCEETMRRWVAKRLVYAVRVERSLLIPAEEVARLSGARRPLPDYKTAAAGPDRD
jgi:hypothetical protein